MPGTPCPRCSPAAPRSGSSVWVIVMLASSIACGGERSRGVSDAARDSTAPSLPVDTGSPAESAPPEDGTLDTSDESSDSTLGLPGALAVLESYFRAINAHQFHEAYHLWSDDGAAMGLTLEEFARGYDRTRSTVYRAGRAGRIEGAAGSRYIDIPVTIEATTTEGVHQRFTGDIILRRLVVTGARPEERRWHIYSARIRQVE